MRDGVAPRGVKHRYRGNLGLCTPRRLRGCNLRRRLLRSLSMEDKDRYREQKSGRAIEWHLANQEFMGLLPRALTFDFFQESPPAGWFVWEGGTIGIDDFICKREGFEAAFRMAAMRFLEANAWPRHHPKGTPT